MSKFLDYYNSEIEKYGGVKNYIIGKAKEKKPLMDRIYAYAERDKLILEAGCGTASNSIFLASKGFRVVGINRDGKNLDLARKNAKTFGTKIDFVEKEVLNLDYPDEEIIRLLNQQLKISKHVIISIPSNFFRQEQVINGDERFLSKKHWKNLISKSNGHLIESFGYFYDSEEIKICALKLLSKTTSNILPLKKPYLGFVVGSK